MAFIVKIEGQESFEVSKECVQTVKYTTDVPVDSNARTKDVGATLTITGKILTAVDGDPFDSTRNMALWSVVPAESADCYRKITIDAIAGGQVVRKYHYPNAFVVDYRETFGDQDGVGTFTLVIKQKKDKLANISIDGGYTA
jgi:hypothetical protein